MSYENPLLVKSAEAAADLSAKQFYFVKLNGSGKLVLAGAGENAIGVLTNKPTTGRTGTFMTDGITKVVAAGAIVEGAKVAAAADGRGETAGSGDHPMGVALEAASGAGAIIAVHLDKTLTPLA